MNPETSTSTSRASDRTGATITIGLRILNTYEDDTSITTEVTTELPAPPPFTDDPHADEEAFWAWSDEHIRNLTGTGRTEGDAWYDVTVTDCSDPDLIGETFQYGY
jgi:hypothetical protein